MALNLFVPLDVDYQDDPKIIEAGALAECLFVRSLALCKKLLNDGRIHRSQLARLSLGIPGPAKRHAQRLVDVGLWVATDDGWALKAWLKRNASASTITSNAAARTAASILANHERWHKDKPKIGCPHCSAFGVRSESESESTEVEVEPEVEPKGEVKPEPQEEEEVEPSSSSSVVELTLVANRPTDDDGGMFLEAVVQAIASERMQSRRPANPVAYKTSVLTDLRTHHREALTTMLANCDWLHTPEAAAAHYQARPELHPKEIA